MLDWRFSQEATAPCSRDIVLIGNFDAGNPIQIRRLDKFSSEMVSEPFMSVSFKKLLGKLNPLCEACRHEDAVCLLIHSRNFTLGPKFYV